MGSIGAEANLADRTAAPGKGGDSTDGGKYLRHDAEGVEVIDDGEEEVQKTIASQFNELQKKTFKLTCHAMRATHNKTQGAVVGKMTIHDNLPPHLAQGMFAKPGVHDVIMRYSSLTPKVVPDTDHAPRGLGIKVFGVEGEKIWGEDKGTQDFTFNNYPILELRNVKMTHFTATSFVKNYDDLSKFGDEMAARPDKEIATRAGSIPKQHLMSMPQYSQGAYRYGDLVAKFGVFPTGEEQKKRANDYIKDDDPIDVLSTTLQEFHKNNKATFSFCVQLLENLDEQPVEDTGIEWMEDKYPFQEVATLEFEPQDSYIDDFRVWVNDRVSCNPWHGLKVHRPLGGAQRTRRIVYAESRKMRLKMNGYSNYIEPASIKEIPLPEGVSLPIAASA